jgi:redox-sensitive bicupin YhaK (pirin superfamily)
MPNTPQSRSQSPVIHPAASRGRFQNNWLSSNHTFSFGDYHDQSRMGFATLRVLNDDTVAPGMGFETHPHNNMEIVSIPLSGALKHQDSVGNSSIIRAGEVQIMSAGTGITHSEFNHSQTEAVHFLQIWILPKKLEIQPRYEQWDYSKVLSDGFAEQGIGVAQVVAPISSVEPGIGINQDARFWIAKLAAEKSLQLPAVPTASGFYFFVIDGTATIDGNQLSQGDGLGRFGANPPAIRATRDAKVLIMGLNNAG